jgi:hypothetical protein
MNVTAHMANESAAWLGEPKHDVEQATTAPTARDEGADGYSRLVAQVDAVVRVVECAAGLQWIVQRRSGRRWRSVSFCCTKEALLRCVREWVPGEHLALEALPDRLSY